MAKKNSGSPAFGGVGLGTPPEVVARRKLSRQIELGEVLVESGGNIVLGSQLREMEEWKNQYVGWRTATEEIVKRAFGDDSDAYKGFRSAGRPGVLVGGRPKIEYHHDREGYLARQIAILGAIQDIDDTSDDAAQTAMRNQSMPLDNIPGAYARLSGDIDRFHADNPFDNSVFVMMKFPDKKRMETWQLLCLEDLFTAVEQELHRHGLVALRADKKTYATNKQIWDNLCIYMLGSKYGIAILEDRVGDELNPNVALEYGFMKGLGREAVILEEASFRHVRADLVGTIPKKFEIDSAHKVDVRSLKDAVAEWLTDVGIAPRRNR